MHEKIYQLLKDLASWNVKVYAKLQSDGANPALLEEAKDVNARALLAIHDFEVAEILKPFGPEKQAIDFCEELFKLKDDRTDTPRE